MYCMNWRLDFQHVTSRYLLWLNSFWLADVFWCIMGATNSWWKVTLLHMHIYRPYNAEVSEPFEAKLESDLKSFYSYIVVDSSVILKLGSSFSRLLLRTLARWMSEVSQLKCERSGCRAADRLRLQMSQHSTDGEVWHHDCPGAGTEKLDAWTFTSLDDSASPSLSYENDKNRKQSRLSVNTSHFKSRLKLRRCNVTPATISKSGPWAEGRRVPLVTAGDRNRRHLKFNRASSAVFTGAKLCFFAVVKTFCSPGL